MYVSLKKGIAYLNDFDALIMEQFCCEMKYKIADVFLVLCSA